MQCPQNSNLKASWLSPSPNMSLPPELWALPSPYWVSVMGGGGTESRTLPRHRSDLASGPAPRPIGRPSGSSVTITEGHNQRGKFAEPYSLSRPEGAHFFQLFWGKEQSRESVRVGVGERVWERKREEAQVQCPQTVPTEKTAESTWFKITATSRWFVFEVRG